MGLGAGFVKMMGSAVSESHSPRVWPARAFDTRFRHVGARGYSTYDNHQDCTFEVKERVKMEVEDFQAKRTNGGAPGKHLKGAYEGAWL